MVSRLIIACIMLIHLTGCERRALTYKQKLGYVIGIRSDWSALETKPLGESVMCYPRDGGAPTVVQTNSVNYTTVALKQGIYDIVVFNQIPSDFGRLNFRGLDAYNTSEIYGVPMGKHESWESDLLCIEEPNSFAVQKLEGFEVTQEMVEHATTSALENTVIDFAPPKVIYTIHIKIEVENIQYLRSARATVSNLAGSYRFHDSQRIDNTAAHHLEQWELVVDKNDKTKGCLISVINTFGISDKEIKEKKLNLSIQLKDKDRTVVSESFGIDKLIKEHEKEMKLSLPLKITNKLPEIDIEGGGAEDAGFDAEIGGWEGDVNQDVNI